MALCEEALNQLTNSLRQWIKMEATPSGCIMVTPFLRSDNEYIQVEITEEDGKLVITDNCETVDYLFANGLNTERSREIQRQIQQIAARFSVIWAEGELFCESGPHELGTVFWQVTNAVREVSSLIYKRVHRLPPTFDEEVEKELIVKGIPYDLNFEVPGKSRLHRFRFHLNHQRNSLVEPLTATTVHAAQVKAERLAFQWVDILEQAQHRFRKVAVVDDVREPTVWTKDALSTLHTYSDNVVLWSNKAELVSILSR